MSEIALILIIVVSILVVVAAMFAFIPPKRVEAAPDPRRYLRDMRKGEMAEWDKEFNRLSGVPEHKPYTWNSPTAAELDHQFWVQMVKENIINKEFPVKQYSEGGVIKFERG